MKKMDTISKQTGQEKFVISDVRFPNEINSILEVSGEESIFWVRGRETDGLPEWFLETAYIEDNLERENYLTDIWPDVHISECAWSHYAFYQLDEKTNVIYNNGTLEELYQKIDEQIVKD